MKTSQWHGAYDKQLSGYIVKEAFSHPAKFSLGLIERIYDHCLTEGYLKAGDVVGDPFGGVGVGGIAAAYRGLCWLGVELEHKFVHLARCNFKLHKDKLDYLGKPQPQIAQGDSREFDQIIGRAQVLSIVSSPPYADGLGHGGVSPAAEKLAREKQHPYFKEPYGTEPGQIERLTTGEVAAVVSSPPYATIAAGAGGLNTKPAKHVGQQTGRSAASASQTADQKYGSSDGQIAGTREGNVDAVISSPPFTQGYKGGGGINKKGYTSRPDLGPDWVGKRTYQGQAGEREPGNIETLKEGTVDGVVSSPPFADSLRGQKDGIDWDKAQQNGKKGEGHWKGKSCNADYGKDPAQIGGMPAGAVDDVVSSPPWEKNYEGGVGKKKFRDIDGFAARMAKGDGTRNFHPASEAAVKRKCEADSKRTYGDSPDNIGNTQKETYWEAVRDVYAACWRAIKPGGVLVLICKDYVKNKARVPLCDDTVRLCEHLGFECGERIHAMLTSESRHADLFTGETIQTRSRKSFFRRLAEKKGSPAIDFEEVLVFRRP